MWSSCSDRDQEWVSEKNVVDPEDVELAWTRLRDFLTKEVSISVYDPIRGRFSSQELYAILQVVFATPTQEVLPELCLILVWTRKSLVGIWVWSTQEGRELRRG